MTERSYLAWVGVEYAPTIADFVREAGEVGAAKRLPNLGVARGLAKDGAVMYLAHSQGVGRVCLACAEQVPCPFCKGDGGEDCRRCRGLGAVEVGTGGYAVVDGERWFYVRYIKLKRHTSHPFWDDEHEIGEVSYCRECGGRGSIPQGLVFARFRPEVLAVGIPGDEPGVRYVALAESASMPRLGGELRAGYYADVTELELLEEPVPYLGKHFRGVKRWSPDLEGES